ncbi:MAG: hypothetical protein QOJ98_3136 [Acidobacteriota bacterium]|jgi:hypothetical protein|nr:hypothetical protein [Acidobacteriota bacterium]
MTQKTLLTAAVLTFVVSGSAFAQATSTAAPQTQPATTPAAVTPPPETPAPPPPPVHAVQTELTTPALQTAIEDFKKAGASPKQTFVTWGEYVTASGHYFVPVMLYVPKASGITASPNLTFFGVVQDASGKNLNAFEVPAKLNATRDDYFVDATLLGLPAGKHRGYFGLAEDGKVISVSTTEMKLAGALDKNAPGVSRLIISNNLYPLQAAQGPVDPFAFGGLKVVPKADRAFRSTDELWYFVELRNPGVAEPAADVVPVTGAPVATPKLQLRVDVEGTDANGKAKKLSAPLREVEAIEVKGVPGHYGVGSGIPLASFQPGEYTLTVKVIDTIRKMSYTFYEKFRVAG